MFNQIMRMSVTAAYYTHEIARSVNLASTPIAFTAGLLHSLGRLVLLYNKPHDYEALWCTGETGEAPSIEAERLIFGTDHARLGALAIDRWNLPGEVGAVIGNYHTPKVIANADLRKLAYTLALALMAAQTACIGAKSPTSEDPPEVLVAFANALGMSPGEAIDLIESVQARIPALPEEMLRD